MRSQDSVFKFIICGTDTDIGKTLISSFFVKGLNSFYWKPIQSGIESQTDSQTVEKLSQVSKEKIIKEAYVFTKPLSPHWASEIDKKTINLEYSGLNFLCSKELLTDFKSTEIHYSEKFNYHENFKDVYKLYRSIKNIGAQSTNSKHKTVKELKTIQKFWPKNYNNTVNLSWQIEIQILKKL